MTEAEVIEQSVEYMGLLLLGVSLIFSVVSAYIVALNYFVGEARIRFCVTHFGSADGGHDRRSEYACGACPPTRGARRSRRFSYEWRSRFNPVTGDAPSTSAQCRRTWTS